MKMSRGRVILAACAFFSLALTAMYIDVLGTSGVVKLQRMHNIYTTATRSLEIDETAHAEISPDFNHLHHTTTGVVNYYNITESAKPRDVKKEIVITKREKVRDVENIVNSKKRVRVIINAKYRTGSSFTGELFIKHSAFAYYFEPLYHFVDLKTGKRISEERILWTLERVFNCTITDTDLEDMLLGLDPQWWKPVVLCGFERGELCNNGLQASNESLPWDERFQALCRSRPHMAVKIIRIWDFSSLLRFIKQGIKIIQLVRDPRGMYLSRTMMGGKQLERDCHGFVNDLKYVRSLYKSHKELVRKSIYFLRYEDLATKPMQTLENIYRFLNVEPDDHVRLWAKNLQKKNEIGEKRDVNLTVDYDYFHATKMSTERKFPAKTAYTWRFNLRQNEINRVQEICGEMLKEFGYTIFNSTEQSRNLHIPQVIDWENVVLFH